MGVSRHRVRLDLLASSKGKKRAAAILVLVSIGMVGADRQKPAPVVRLPRVTFAQLDVEFDGDRHQKSAWGAVDLRFLGASGVLYFNLAVVSGNSATPVWRIQNIPILSREGAVAQTTTATRSRSM